MNGSESINANALHQESNQKPQSFEVGSEDYLPVYNPLKGGFQSAQTPSEGFGQQFFLPYPKIPPKTFDPHIFLPDYTYKDISNQSLNIINPQVGFYNKQNLHQYRKVEKKSKVSEKPHYYNLVDATYKVREESGGAFDALKPVPIVKLNKKEVSYTQTINNLFSYSPASSGMFKASDSMLGLVIGFVLFFLYLRTVFGKQIKLFYKSAFNRVRAVNVFEERGIITGRVSFVLNIFYFFVLGMLGMHLLDYTGYIIRGVNPLGLFFILAGGFIAIYIVKYIFGRILGHLLKFNEYTLAFFFHTFIFNKTYAVFIFPFLLIIPYVDSEWALLLLKGSIVLYGVFYIFRTFRVLLLTIQINVSIFYLFLYLCALEIVPVLVIVKIASKWLQLSVF